jgi:O-succinylbenzoic acid--CoA ligase
MWQLTVEGPAGTAPEGRTIVADPTVATARAIVAALERDEGLVLVDPRWGERERAHLAPPPPRGLIVHTSGTTGRPRPVTLTPENLEAAARTSNAALGLAPGDRWLAPLQLSHVAGLMILLRCALSGATAVLGPASLDATYVSLVPTQLKRLLDAGATGPATVILGGAPAPRPLLARARDAGIAVRVAYGLTQTAAQVTMSEPGDLETCGRPLPGADIRAEDGELVVRGPMVAGGEVRTGDLGHLDEQGRVVVTGRRDDLIVSGGENVMPAEVEAVLLEDPRVADAAVFGRPDPEWGSAVVARVVPVPGATPDPEELRARCGAVLARYKVPKAIEIADALPRTPGGKLLRRELA